LKVKSALIWQEINGEDIAHVTKVCPSSPVMDQ
jgi:hypothetical protein